MMDIKGVVSKLESAVTELVTLKITTRVGIDGDPAQKVLRTVIDLAQGDITMQVDPWFLDPAQKTMLDLHAARERQGADIVRANVAAIARLIKLLPDLKLLV
jgi:hypothetical protein